MFACLGFYPFNPCGGEYVLGEAQLDEVKLRVGSGEFRVAREGAGERVLLNGRPVDGVKIAHKDNDGVNWVVVDMVQGFNATSRRNKLAYTARF